MDFSQIFYLISTEKLHIKFINFSKAFSYYGSYFYLSEFLSIYNYYLSATAIWTSNNVPMKCFLLIPFTL